MSTASSTRRVTSQEPKAKTTVPATSSSRSPSKSITITLKRRAEGSPTVPGKKAKFDDVEDDEDEEDEQTSEEDEPEELSVEVQGRLDYLTVLVEGLSKSYLKDVMKGISFYGSRSGTNRVMAAAIIEKLTEDAQNGDDLEHQESVIKGVHRTCYGGCGDSEDEESGS